MTKTDVTLPADLVEQVLKLTPQQQDKLIDLLYDAMDGPPDDMSELIRERVEQVMSGNYQALSEAEADDRIRRALDTARAARRS
jgi:hypothetical protein